MTAAWLCDAGVVERIESAWRSPAPELLLRAQAYAAATASADLLRVDGRTARIAVSGTLTKAPDFWASLFGDANTTYSDIRRALASAVGDPEIDSIVLEIDSPGGEVDGLFDTLDAVAHARASGKKIYALAERAQSAAYGIAAATGRIEARGRGATFGSIGTAVSMYHSPQVVTMTNSDSPDKRPDVSTPAGRAVVVEYLDQINSIFVDAIAKGRGITTKSVASEYGRGQSYTAENALDRRMIDHIHSASSPSKGKTMASEVETLRAQLAAAEARANAAESSNAETATTLSQLVAQVSALTAASTVNAHAARVDELQRAGKLPPALRGWALKQAPAVLEAYAADAPAAPAVTSARVDAPAAPTSPTKLTSEQKKVCEAMGLTEKEFLEEQAVQIALQAERRASVRGEESN